MHGFRDLYYVDYDKEFRNLFNYISRLSGAKLSDLYFVYLRSQFRMWGDADSRDYNLIFMIDHLKKIKDPRWRDAVFLYLAVDGRGPGSWEDCYLAERKQLLIPYFKSITANHVKDAFESNDPAIKRGAHFYFIIFPDPKLLTIFEEKVFGSEWHVVDMLLESSALMSRIRLVSHLVPMLAFLHSQIQIGSSEDIELDVELVFSVIQSFGESVIRFGVNGVNRIVKALLHDRFGIRVAATICLAYLGSDHLDDYPKMKSRSHQLLRESGAENIVQHFSKLLSESGESSYPIAIDWNIQKWLSCAKLFTKDLDKTSLTKMLSC